MAKSIAFAVVAVLLIAWGLLFILGRRRIAANLPLEPRRRRSLRRGEVRGVVVVGAMGLLTGILAAVLAVLVAQ